MSSTRLSFPFSSLHGVLSWAPRRLVTDHDQRLMRWPRTERRDQVVGRPPGLAGVEQHGLGLAARCYGSGRRLPVDRDDVPTACLANEPGQKLELARKRCIYSHPFGFPLSHALYEKRYTSLP